MMQTLVDGYGLDVRFGWPNLEDPELQPWGHAPGDDGKLRFYAPGDPYALSSILAPAGDLSMHPLHYARYVQQHLRGLRGFDGYVSASTMRHIHRAQRGFSLGVVNGRYYGKNVSQVDGSAGTFYCHTIIVPDADFAYVILTNAGGSDAMAGVYELSGQIMNQRFRPWWRFWG
jgi:D-alanyl-D-alanine carboxypeptidase